MDYVERGQGHCTEHIASSHSRLGMCVVNRVTTRSAAAWSTGCSRNGGTSAVRSAPKAIQCSAAFSDGKAIGAALPSPQASKSLAGWLGEDILPR